MPLRRQIDASALSAFIRGLYRLQDESALIGWIVAKLPRLIGCDNAFVGQHQPATRMVLNLRLLHPYTRMNFLPEVNDSGILQDHPFFGAGCTHGGTIKVLSELMSSRDWCRHPLYAEVLREDGVRDHMTADFADNAEVFTMIGLGRSIRGFSKAETDCMRQLIPHFRQALRNARLFNACKATAGAAADPSVSLLQLDQGGRFIKDVAGRDPPEGLLSGLDDGTQRDLLLAWLDCQIAQLNRGVGEEWIPRFRSSRKGVESTLTLHRHWGNCGYLLCHRINPGKRAKLPGKREREVLHWVARGKTTAEIAAILGLSEHTVKDYLRSACSKLGAGSRIEAVALLARRERILQTD
jgi:DNA-binding CsgD family transcriptional regulator